MAQVKVTDFFSVKKRNSELHPAKRQKLRQSGNFSRHAPEVNVCADQSLDAQNATTAKNSKPKSEHHRRSKRQTTQKHQQKLLTDLCTPSASKSLETKAPSKNKFDFKLDTVVPSSCDSTVTEYDTPTTPHSTPSKRAHSKRCGKSQSLKRKRKSLEQSVPVTPNSNVSVITKTKSTSTRKRLDMPGAASNQRDDSTDKVAVESDSTDKVAVESDSTDKVTVESDSTDKVTVESDSTDKVTVQSDSTDKVTVQSDSADKVAVESDSADKVAVESDSASLIATDSLVPTQCASNMKAMISSCGTLADLKACLHKVQRMSKELKERQAVKGERVAKTSAPPEKEEIKPTQPAYEKYKELVTKIPPTLTLPYKYRLLEDMFRSADTIVSMMYNRMERCTYSKLKKGVQDMLRKNFELHHLGQIMTVYPESYAIRQEKGVVENGVRSNKYCMTIEPMINVDQNNKVSERKDGRPVLCSNEVVRRRGVFRARLFGIVKDHHQRFLDTLSPSVRIDSTKVTQWHPKFRLDEVPEPESAELPQPPETSPELVTATDVLNAAKGRLPTKVEQALMKVANESTKVNNQKKIDKTATDVKSTSVNKSCKNDTKKTAPARSVSGISASLLERIRAKEALKTQAAMLRDETTENEISMLGRLPAIIKIIRSYFITEKKSSVAEENVIIKLCDSYHAAISQSSVESHINYMLKVLPEWITRVSVSSGKYIKINKQTELSQLNKELSLILKQKQCTIPK